ncbi:MAG: DUF2306 domain-containing protein [Betaproteobacteria bacterium]|nr:DUF2306 domain-containing protein [Betaproteobacteria bacterium]
MSTATPPIIHSFANAPWYVHAHMFAAVVALLIGAAVLARRKGTASHKVLGWLWVTLMLFSAVTSFAIHARDRLSLIHGLSVAVLIGLPTAILFVRGGNVRGHRLTMMSLFAGLVIAGAFTLLPYRMLGQLLFGPR